MQRLRVRRRAPARLFPAAKADGPRYVIEPLEARLLLTITEPNDSIAQAYNLGTLSSTQSINDSVGTSDVNDYIKFTTTAAGTVNLTLSGLTSNADLQLLNSAGSTIWTSNNTGTAVDHIDQLLAAGTYYARVNGVSGTTNYNLAFSYAAQTLTSKFAVIGDYGLDGPNELAVANLVKGWNPDFIATVGDNNYEDGLASTIDANIGKYYHDYILNYHGSFGAGSATRRFFPAIGNHEYGAQDDTPSRLSAYTNYFDLPGNERYYDYVQGPVHFFVINSDGNEPDGNDVGSVQANWLQAGLAAATEPFKIVYFHHPAYSSGSHGNNDWMQWPFQQWGATAVMSGHDHDYERLSVGGLTYFVDGTGGAELSPLVSIDPSVSKFQLAGVYGAMLVTVSGTAMTFEFYTADGTLQERYTLDPVNPRNDVTLTASDASAAEPADNGAFTLTRAGSTASALVVNYQITGRATNGSDYQTLTTSATIPAGQSSVNIPINVINDSIGESDETVTLTLAASSNYNIATKWSDTVTIHDDDVTRTNIFPAGSVWKYYDKGTDLGTTWRNLGFSDSAWSSGPAQLGYGDGDEATPVSFGPDANNKYITTYFRRSFNVTNAAAVSGLDLSLLIDDGAVIYINGTEVARYNMPAGTITYLTQAVNTIAGADESAFHDIPIGASALVNGANVIAVEVHQSVSDSSDISFDLKMDGLFDTGAPNAPSTPDLTDASDSGISSSDNITKINTPTFTGTAEPGSTVKLFSDGTQVGSVAAAAGTGAWQITASSLLDGTRQITATATDAAGNVSAISTALAVVIDTLAPTVAAGAFAYQTSHNISFSFNEDVSGTIGVEDLSVRKQGDPSDLSTNGVTKTYGVGNVATFTYTGQIPNGTYHGKLITAGVTDAAGNAVSSDGGFDFFVLAADGNRNGTVEITDFNILAANFGKSGETFTQGNYDYSSDGTITLLDFNVLAANFGKQVMVPTGPGSVPTENALAPTLPENPSIATSEDDLATEVLA
jgi:hypothetical protein